MAISYVKAAPPAKIDTRKSATHLLFREARHAAKHPEVVDPRNMRRGQSVTLGPIATPTRLF